MMGKARHVLPGIFVTLLLVGCASLVYTPAPSPMPVDYVPTLMALTAQADVQARVTPSPVLAPEDTQPPSPTSTVQPATVTIGPSPTSLAYNPTSTASLQASATSTPNLSPTATVSRRATRTPTITPTPTVPVARVQVIEPGPMSKVTSPIHLLANVRSIPSGSYHVELWAEPLQPGGEPRLLYREVQRIISNPIDWVYIDEDIQFELSRVSEFGQLRVSTFDQYGRTFSVNSVDLILLSMGPNELTPRGYQSETIVIYEPTPNHLIQGGVVIVSGLARPAEEFMLVELEAFDGTISGYRQVFTTPSPDGSYVPYAVEVPYTVSTPTWVRLRISESGLRIPGIEHLTSVEVLLSP